MSSFVALLRAVNVGGRSVLAARPWQISQFDAFALNYMHPHETVKLDAIASTAPAHGLAITPPVMGNGTPVVAG